MNKLSAHKIVFSLGILGLSLACGCSKKEERIKTLAELVPSNLSSGESIPKFEPKEEPPRYFYPYSNKRDPFTPLIGGPAAKAAVGSEGLHKGELTNLELKGILRDRKGKVAIISASDGESFFLRSGRVYDRKNRIISGVSGIIKDTSVILISQNKAMTELSLKGKEKGMISVNSPSQ